MRTHYFKKGFTLVEILVVISIFGILISVVAATFNNSRNEIALQDARATLLSAFEKARNRAASGVSTEPHGVKISGNKIIICEGEETSCITTGEIEFLFPISVSTDKPDVPIVFNRISAKPSTGTTIILENTIDGTTTTVTVTKEGRIIGQ